MRRRSCRTPGEPTASCDGLREAAVIEGFAIHEPEVLADLAAGMGLDRECLERDFAGPCSPAVRCRAAATDLRG